MITTPFSRNTLRLILALSLAVISMTASAGNAKYYGALQVIAQPTGAGFVYSTDVKNYSGEINESTHISDPAELENEGSHIFYGYARPASDQCKFLGWSYENDELILTTDNMVEVEVPCKSTNSQSPTTITYWAHFVQPSTEAFALTLMPANHGSYTIDTDQQHQVISTSAVQITQESGILTFELSPTADPDYKFFAWYTLSDDGQKVYRSYEPTFQTSISEDMTLYAEFIAADTPLFELPGSTRRYVGIENAIDAAKAANVSQIILSSDGILKGQHTIPAGMSLIIPYDNLGTSFTNMPRAIHAGGYTTPFPYRTLTLAPDATLEVRGDLHLSACIWAPNGGACPAGGVLGPYGCIQTLAGSTINLYSSAHLYCWGYLLGEGQVNAMSGATVHELFQFTDWRGGSPTAAFTNADVFPVNQYYIQNIECTLNLQYGSTEKLSSAVFAAGKIQQAAVDLVSTQGSLFVLKPNSQLTRRYDPSTDRINYTIQGDAALSSITVDLAGALVHSELFTLPITNNMSIAIQQGTTTMEYDTALLPGASLTIAADATLAVADSTSLILYDAEDWGPYAGDNIALHPLTYLPTSTCHRMASDLTDAVLHIDGTLDMGGFLYATQHGSPITSLTGGMINFRLGQGDRSCVYQATGSTGVEENAVAFVDTIPLTAPRLENGDGTYVVPGSEASTYVYEAEEGVWRQIIMGDINDDRVVNVSDVTALVDIILGKRSGVRQADINGDRKYDITDVTLLVNMILNKRG